MAEEVKHYSKVTYIFPKVDPLPVFALFNNKHLADKNPQLNCQSLDEINIVFEYILNFKF